MEIPNFESVSAISFFDPFRWKPIGCIWCDLFSDKQNNNFEKTHITYGTGTYTETARRLHADRHAYRDTQAGAHVGLCRCACLRVCVNVSVCVSTYACPCVCLSAWMCMCVCASHRQTPRHRYTQALRQTHIHTDRQTRKHRQADIPAYTNKHADTIHRHANKDNRHADRYTTDRLA